MEYDEMVERIDAVRRAAVEGRCRTLSCRAYRLDRKLVEYADDKSNNILARLVALLLALTIELGALLVYSWRKYFFTLGAGLLIYGVAMALHAWAVQAALAPTDVVLAAAGAAMTVVATAGIKD